MRLLLNFIINKNSSTLKNIFENESKAIQGRSYRACFEVPINLIEGECYC